MEKLSKKLNNFSLLSELKNRLRAFSLVELMISLIIISLVAAAFTPIITKKLSSSSIISGNMGKIITKCEENFGENCKLCTNNYCINCTLSCPQEGTFLNSDVCKCQDCSKFDSSDGIFCQSCKQKGCEKCSSGYIENGYCTPCPSGFYCNGKTKTDVCPSGYYCDSSHMKNCADYDKDCISCNLNTCLTCDTFTRLNAGVCEPCSNYLCRKCDAGANICTECDSQALLDTNTNDCSIICGTIPGLENCYRCTDRNTCTVCDTGYYVNSNHKCEKCDLPNCVTCEEGARVKSCAICAGGYTLNSQKQCVSCKIATGNQYCSYCNGAKCLSCQKGYALDGNGNCKKADGTKFNCSDKDFMRIGNLCFTRRNLGDGESYSDLSQYATVVNSGGATCPAYTSKCCWRAKSNCCTDDNGDYSGCNRTVCNYKAANNICANLNYAGKTWRLPTLEELKIASLASISMGEEGMMFTDSFSGTGSAQACTATDCFGASSNYCGFYRTWSNDSVNDNIYYQMALEKKTWYYGWGSTISAAVSVRCVTDM